MNDTVIISAQVAKVNKLLNKIHRIQQFYSRLEMNHISEKLKDKYLNSINTLKECLDRGQTLSKENMEYLNTIWGEIRQDYKNIQ